METRLTDLDAILLTVRNPSSRSYIDEAVRAYRAGSYKASIVAVWVAVTFDIIAKIRELAESDDAEAARFVATFDQNVAVNNIAKLLEIEGKLLDDAEHRFAFLDSISRRHFDRLKEDRNLCAHPAFTADGILFMPEPEQVRLYIAEAVRNLLSQRPVQGKTIIKLFDVDLRGTAFPTEPERIPRFVEHRYLANTRRNVLGAFAQVLAKALLRAAPAGWERRLHLLPYALSAIKAHDADIWSSQVRPTIVGLIEAADDERLPYAYTLLAAFHELYAALPEPARARLHAFIRNYQPELHDLRGFQAAMVPDFTAEAAVSFSSCTAPVQSMVVTLYPLPAFWPTCMKHLAAAKSFRHAESLFSQFAAPYEATATVAQLSELLATVGSNYEIYDASGIPAPLAAFARSVAGRHPIGLPNVADFIDLLDEQDLRKKYRDTLEIFEQAGVEIPPPPPEEE